MKKCFRHFTFDFSFFAFSVILNEEVFFNTCNVFPRRQFLRISEVFKLTELDS